MSSLNRDLDVSNKIVRPVILHENDCELETWDDEEKGFVTWRTLVSGDRTPTEGLTCGVAELPVGRTTIFRMHRHAPPEIYYVLEGFGALKINNQEYAVKKGSTIYIPSNDTHCLINCGDVPLRLFYVFAADSFSDIEYEFPQS